MQIVGVDCATINRKTGLAFAHTSGAALTIDDCSVGRAGSRISEQIQGVLSAGHATLLALDAPLGWPAALGKALSEHAAGRGITADSGALFRRRTDRVVRERLGKAPLEVGANFIARTAAAALRLLAEVSELNRVAVPLAWEPAWEHGIRAIEVYPAGTLRAYERMGLVGGAGTAQQAKHVLLLKLRRQGRLRFRDGLLRATENEHVRDSVLCCVAALDFLEGKAMRPDSSDTEIARKEGWIWVRDPDL